jgi:hypothetical protein
MGNRKREGQCDAEAESDDAMHFCILDAYHPGQSHLTAKGWRFGSEMERDEKRDLATLEKLREGIRRGGFEIVERDLGLPPGELKKLMAGVPSERPTPLPPWVCFHRGDGTADIMPAGRPGDVITKLPLELAQAIVRTANTWRL